MKHLITICLFLTSQILTSQVYVTDLAGSHYLVDLDNEQTNEDSIIESWFITDYTDTIDTLTIGLIEIESAQLTDIIKTLNQNVAYLNEMVAFYKEEIVLLGNRQKNILKELKKLKSK